MGLSIWHWLIILIVLLVYIAPAALILRKAGYSPWWCLVLIVPFLNVIGIWVFAIARWPVGEVRRG